jgi:hypothetical protein
MARKGWLVEGNPAHHRDSLPETPDDDFTAPAPPSKHGPGAVRLVLLAIAFGVAVAVATVVRAGVLSATPAGQAGAWLVSAVAIAVIAAFWLAGIVHLAALFLRGGRGAAASPRSGWPASLAAFAAGPFLVALFFFGTQFARFPATGFVAYPLAAGIVLLLLFARKNVRLLAERLLISFFLWVAILIVPTFWRDPVNDQMSSFLFGLLKAAGLLS